MEERLPWSSCWGLTGLNLDEPFAINGGYFYGDPHGLDAGGVKLNYSHVSNARVERGRSK